MRQGVKTERVLRPLLGANALPSIRNVGRRKKPLFPHFKKMILEKRRQVKAANVISLFYLEGKLW
jgi:hypothetical protein